MKFFTSQFNPLYMNLFFLHIILIQTIVTSIRTNFMSKNVVNIGTQLCLQACKILQRAYKGQNIKTYLKAINDPVTDIDFKIQRMLTEGFKTHFPQLKIIGQENITQHEKKNYDYYQLEDGFLPSYLNLNDKINLQQACLWIDPIDCTRGLIDGYEEDVTVLIGMSYRKKAYLGFIGTPFKKINGQILFDPYITVGNVATQQTFQYLPYQSSSWKQLKSIPYHPLKKLTVATSLIRQNKKQQTLIQTLNARNLQAGGSGRKIMMVANQQADLMTFIDSYTHKWDSCAGEAIVKSMGGKFSTSYGKEIEYDPFISQTRNKEGFVCSLHQQIHDIAINTIRDMSSRIGYKDKECNIIGGQGYRQFLTQVIL